ncbi:MAG: hypothetical protein OCD01_12000 [Fibrobacterales bacterium]
MSSQPLYATIDIGSNSALLLIATVTEGKLEAKVQKIGTCRLGQGVQSGEDEATAESIAQTRKVLTQFRQTIHNIGAKLVKVVLTEATRRAKNKDAILSTVRETLMFEPDILSGEDEALWTWESISNHYEINDFISLDIGAGSTELCDGTQALSLPLGALDLKNRFGKIPTDDIKEFIDAILTGQELEGYKKKPLFLIGGTATALAMIEKGQTEFKMESVEGYQCNRHGILNLITTLGNMSNEIREQLPGLDDNRSEIMIPGLKVIERCYNALDLETATISTLGLRYGALLKSL